MKTLKTLKSLEIYFRAWKNLELWKMQNKTLKSLNFMTATCHNFHNFGLFVIIFFKNQNVDTFIIIFIISARFENEFWKKCLLLFGSNSLKVLILFVMNSEKTVYYCLVVTLWKCQYCLIWTLEKVFTIACLLMFGSNFLKVSVLFGMNSKKSVYYCLVVTHWKCQYCLVWTLKKVFTIVW